MLPTPRQVTSLTEPPATLGSRPSKDDAEAVKSITGLEKKGTGTSYARGAKGSMCVRVHMVYVCVYACVAWVCVIWAQRARLSCPFGGR